MMRKAAIVVLAAANLAVIGFAVRSLARGWLSRALAQSAEPLPQFEVASIKASHTGDESSGWSDNNGRLDMRNVNLTTVILAAYQVKDYQLSAPDWLSGARFDIHAKAPEGFNQSDLPRMMQSMLVNRFHLGAHREKKPMAAYALVVAKGGLKVKPVEAPAPGSSNNSRSGPDGVVHLVAQRVSMDRLAAMLFRMVGMPVVNKTEIDGVFDFKLDYVQNNKPDDSSLPTLFTALPEQLGVKLQSERLPVEILVVDRCDKVPTEN